MKMLKLFICLYCLFISSALFAQTPKAVESDLYKSFKRIDYWNKMRFDTKVNPFDSLLKANLVFGKKLKFYCNNFPIASEPPFNDSDLKTIYSKDNLFRIFSWDTETGGTMLFFDNVMQYKSSSRFNSIFNADTSQEYRSYNYYYSDLYTFSANGSTYYLTFFYGKFSSRIIRMGVQIFSIEDGKLNENTKIIKTASGLHSKLVYDFDPFSDFDSSLDAGIHYNETSKTISIPIIVADGKVTKGHITYKFTGKYFEKI
jgi:hypothetical protein